MGWTKGQEFATIALFFAHFVPFLSLGASQVLSLFDLRELCNETSFWVSEVAFCQVDHLCFASFASSGRLQRFHY